MKPILCRNRNITRILLVGISTALVMMPLVLQAATPAERGQWMASMGESGLRRFYSSGSDLGEMVNRAVSYQTAQRVYNQQQGNPATAPTAKDMHSRSDTWVMQSDSLIPVADSWARPVFLRALVRLAARDEDTRVDSRNDRLDIGVLYAPSSQSFISLGVAGEITRADIYYVTGQTRGKAWGPRVDAGLVLGPVWAVGIRADYLRFDGDNEVRVMTGGGPLTIMRDIESQRRYLQMDAMARFNQMTLPWLPGGSVLSWTNSFRHLHTTLKPTRNSLGLSVAEPFGQHERLSLISTGLNLSYPLGEGGRWSIYGDVSVDYELETNMNFPVDDRTAVTLGSGIVRQIARGQRVQLEYQRYQHARDTRSRNNLSLIAVVDF